MYISKFTCMCMVTAPSGEGLFSIFGSTKSGANMKKYTEKAAAANHSSLICVPV